ncbi:UDP-forming cellulose synthase catalytic subunit [Pigmentiphaga sp. YJ18]|uniref:UDP-forming cellulose synthase catalytic subunit n=1 Tax=Pigmentiphaga sp. YJ18 TaxID=3134907 RepID=UPI0031112405
MSPLPPAVPTSHQAPADARADRLAALPLWNHPLVRIVLAAVACFSLAVVITAPLEALPQLLLSLVALVAALVLRNVAGRLPTVLMVLLSATMSLRYMYWRLTSTLDFQSWLDIAFGYGLLLAEIYALSVLLLGYLQTIWPLRRLPAAMPADPATWPSVDILIPTYNEPLDVVKQSVLTAVSLDWPADRLHIFVLDDGRRKEFQDFCSELGVGYIARSNNESAKAGNLNAALELTSSEYVAVFDCDHIPTRSFLQICIGWFLKDPKLAMLQTPHYFFSADPFEKNLHTFRAVPNEGELFYGLVQDGNDLWNAAFFCGSCAVLRRSQLEEVGGIATETVTEDAHTALKLNRAGYNTAYLAVPQAAGLATENLSRHIGQRVRWARGMAQIFRVDNPLFGKGLSLSQRMCYLNAMLHFFYGLPRLVFLTAPLAFLFFGAHVFQASALMITLYAFPHLIHANLTSSRMQGRFRHSFWNEVYESVLAWYIMRPALLALINPKLGKFNVTAKGGAQGQAWFDWDMAKPYLVLLALNIAGLIAGLISLAVVDYDSGGLFTLAINLVWTLYNIIITSASIAVAREERQFRSQPRVAAQIPAMLRLPNGKTVACSTTDYSATGLGIQLPPELERLEIGQELHVALFRGTEQRVFPATIVFSTDHHLGLRFESLTLQQQVEMAEMTFARADTWAENWGQNTPDAPLVGLREVVRIGVLGMKQLALHGGQAVRARLQARPIQTRMKNR